METSRFSVSVVFSAFISLLWELTRPSVNLLFLTVGSTQRTTHAVSTKNAVSLIDKSKKVAITMNSEGTTRTKSGKRNTIRMKFPMMLNWDKSTLFYGLFTIRKVRE